MICWKQNSLRLSLKTLRALSLVAAMSMVLCAVGIAPAGAETWTGAKSGCGEPGASPCGDNGTWGDKYNWSPESVPTSNATIAFGHVEGGPRDLAGLTVTGGEVYFNDLFVTGALRVEGGQVFVANVARLGGLLVSSGLLRVDSGAVVNGVFNWTGGALSMGSTGLEIPAPDGELHISGPAPKHIVGKIVNRGTVTASGRGVTGEESYLGGGVGAGGDGGPFDNYGTFTINGAYTFDQDASSGNQKTFNNFGTFIKDGGGTTDMGLFQLNNTGIVQVKNGTLVPTMGGTSNGEWTVLPGAVLNLSNFAQLGSGVCRFDTGTTIAGGGQVRMDSGLVYCAGDVPFGTTATPTTFVLNGGTLTSVTPKKFSITSGNTMNWTGGSLEGVLEVAQGGTLNISGIANKTFTAVINNAGITNWTGPGKIVSTNSEFNNQATGQWRLLSDGDVFGANSGGAFGTLTNAGTLSKYAGAGTTSFEFGINNTGILEVRSGVFALPTANLWLDSGSLLTGAGTHRIFGGGIYGNTTVAGTVEMVSGTLFTHGDTQRFTVAASANFNWKGGRLQAGGSQAPDAFTIAQGGNLNISGPALKEFDRITNAGTTTLDGGGDLTGYAGVFTNTGTFNALNGATFIAGAYNNAGHSTFLNEGTLNIGTSGTAGVFNVTQADYTQTATGKLNIDLASASSFDRLNLNGVPDPGVGGGTATLAGSVNVSLLGTFLPAVNGEFRVITHTTNVGTFSSVVDKNSSDQRFYTATYNPTNVTIVAKDTPPVIGITGPATAITEGNSGSANATFPVKLSKASTQTVTVNYTTVSGTASAGSDFTNTNGTLTFAPGQLTKFVFVPIVGDLLDEENELFSVRLSAPVNAVLGATTTVTATITDDDEAPSFVVTNPRAFLEGSAGAPGSTTFGVRLSAPSAKTITVNYQTADGLVNGAVVGSDYLARSGTLTFTPSQTLKTVTVPFIGEAIAELNETFFLDIKTPINATIASSRGKAFIGNDDGPSISIDNAVSVQEGNGGTVSQTFNVRLSAASTNTVTVNWATGNGPATGGAGPADFTVANGTLTFAPGEISKTITIQVKGDTTVEPTEKYFVNLTRPTFATIADSQGSGFILNDDVSAGLASPESPSQ